MKLRGHGWHITLLTVGLLVLTALVLNLLQGGVWVVSGMSGKNAYELAVENGYEGSLQDWLASLAGSDGQNGTDGQDGSHGQNGKSAYELAVENGFRGTLQEWLLSLSFGEDGADGKDGMDGENGKDGNDGQDGVGIRSVYINEQGHLIVILTDGSRIDAGVVNAGGTPPPVLSDFEKAQAEGYPGTRHEWLLSYLDGSRETAPVTGAARDAAGNLIVALEDGTTLNAGAVPADGFLSDAMDAEGFRPRFSWVRMNHEASMLNLRLLPNNTDSEVSPAVAAVSSGEELVCVGSAELEGELFYRFLRVTGTYPDGVFCYAKAKYFDEVQVPQAELLCLHLPEHLVLTAGVPFRFVTEEILQTRDESYALVYRYGGGEALRGGIGGIVTLTPVFADGTASASHAPERQTLTVSLCRSGPAGTEQTLETRTVRVTVVPPAELPGLTGLVIGDSRVASGELLSALTEGAEHLRLLGTLTDADGHPCEARGGWKAENVWLTQAIGGVSNAFWNPAVQRFDFAYYMNTYYADTALDFVVIHLGANDRYTRNSVACVERMVQSIHAYHPDIAVLVMGEPVTPRDLDADGTVRPAQYRYMTLQAEAFAGREDEGLYLLPTHLCVDTGDDRVNSADPDAVPVRDWVHLGEAGYRREAEVLSAYLRWLFCE